MSDNDITYEIRGAVYDVYKALGPGLLESVYEEALVFELEQLLTYLRLMNKKVGLLVNFNTDNILMSIDRIAN